MVIIKLLSQNVQEKNCKIIAIKELDTLKFDKKNISDFVAIKDLPDFISRTGFKIEE